MLGVTPNTLGCYFQLLILFVIVDKHMHVLDVFCVNIVITVNREIEDDIGFQED